MTYFKEIRVGKFVLRFYPSDNGWMCGITPEMMQAMEAQPKREWVGLTDDEVSKILDNVIGFNSCWGPEEEFARAIEAKLKEKNCG